MQQFVQRVTPFNPAFVAWRVIAMKLRAPLRTLVCALVIGFSFFGNFKSALAITYNVNQTIGLSTDCARECGHGADIENRPLSSF